MPDHTKDRAIDALAQRQHGAFSTKQADRLGFSAKERRTRIRNGRWLRMLDSNVLAHPAVRPTWERQCTAAVLSVPGGAVSGEAACALLEIPGFRRSTIEVATRHGTTHRSPFAAVRQLRTVGQIIVVDGIRCVSHADALVQVAPAYDLRRFGALVDEAVRMRRRTIEELHDLVASLLGSRLPAIGVVREALAEREPGYSPPTSELNRILHELLAGLTLPAVEFEATPPWVEPGEQFVDALIEPWKMIVEADGRDYHTRVADFERDHERDVVAAANGYLTLRFTWHKLTRRATWCRNAVLAAGATRAHLGALGGGCLAGAVLLG